MNLGNIVEPNSKGQIVIPFKIRQALGITPDTPLSIFMRGEGVYIQPIKGIITSSDSDSNEAYLEVLKRTQGSWRGDDWEKTEKKRKKIELKASAARKKAW